MPKAQNSKRERLPAIDLPAIAEEAEQQVQKELGVLPHGKPYDLANLAALDESALDSLLRRSSAIAQQADAEYEALRPTRDAAGLTLSLLDGVRAVNTVIGVGRTHFHEMRLGALGLLEKDERGVTRPVQWLRGRSKEEIAKRARQQGVKRLREARRVAPDVGLRAARAEARRHAARGVRDRVAMHLYRSGMWQREKIAKVIGVNASRITHIIDSLESKAAKEKG